MEFFGQMPMARGNTFRRNRDCRQFTFFQCALIAMEIFGRERMAADWIASKEKFSPRRADFIRSPRNPFPKTKAVHYGLPLTRMAFLVGTQIPNKILSSANLKAPQQFLWMTNNKSGQALARKAFFNFRRIILFPRPVPKFSARKSLRCLKTVRDKFGRARKTALQILTEKNGHCSRQMTAYRTIPFALSRRTRTAIFGLELKITG